MLSGKMYRFRVTDDLVSPPYLELLSQVIGRLASDRRYEDWRQ